MKKRFKLEDLCCANCAAKMEAGIKNTGLLIATTDSDELNMLCCLIAKKAGKCHTIARIRNPEYSNEIHFIQ